MPEQSHEELHSSGRQVGGPVRPPAAEGRGRGGWLCPSARPCLRRGSWGIVTTCLPGTVLLGVSALRSPALPAAQVHEQRALPAAEVPRRDEDAVSGGGAVSCGGDP